MLSLSSDTSHHNYCHCWCELVNIDAVYIYAHFTTTPSAAASVVAVANPALTTTKDKGNPRLNCLNVFFIVQSVVSTVEFLMILTKFHFKLYELIGVRKLQASGRGVFKIRTK